MTNKNKNDDTYERAVLGAILLNTSNFDIAYNKGLKPDFFDNDKHKSIFKVMQEMNASFIKVDSFSCITYARSNEKLEECGGIPYINELEHEVPTDANISFYIDQVIISYKKRKLQEAKDKLFADIENVQNGTMTLSQMQEEIQKASDQLKDLNNNIFSESKEDYDKGSAFSNVFNLLQNIETKNFDKVISTGFKGLDFALEGGLTPKLFIIGAISSMGKTTLMLQVADQLAEADNGVIFFSMEMSAKELASKSFSRLSYQNDRLNPLSAIDILTGKKGEGFSNDEMENLRASVGKYQKYAKNFRYEIGIKKPSEIRRCINSYIHFTGKKPIVFIDYLQLIAPEDSRLIDKQAIDSNLTALKGLSVDFDIPIVTISSFNRDAYNSEVSMSSFKESGKIEYSADILLGLQPFGMSNEKDNNNVCIIQYNEIKAGNGEEYPVELKVLKQRFGSKPKVTFFYRPRYDVFRDARPDETREKIISKQKYDISNINKQPSSKTEESSSIADDD